jgi:hypothetical protein
MILLVTPSARVSECAAALQAATDEQVVVAESLARASTLLREDSYLAVVLDQYLLETEPDEVGTTIEHLDTAILVQVNFGISGMERVLREVQAALQCRQREEVRARRAAISQLHSELNSTLTALLLSSELALQSAGLPPAAAEKLQAVYELVKKLRRLLESASLAEEVEQAVTR